jgi:hypothetical protein
MRVEGVTRVATGDVQVPEVLAGLDVCVGQPPLKLGDNDLFAARFFAVQFFALPERGPISLSVFSMISFLVTSAPLELGSDSMLSDTGHRSRLT